MNQDDILEILRGSPTPLTKYDIRERAGIGEDEFRRTNWHRRFRALERWGQAERVGTDPETRCIRWRAVR